jgi:hypothetical protein
LGTYCSKSSLNLLLRGLMAPLPQIFINVLWDEAIDLLHQQRLLLII